MQVSNILIFIWISLIPILNCHKHSEHPLMLLISFDGFRWDYLSNKTHNLSNFEALIANGSHAEFIYNSFSTITFPNHWTIVTGLYEESHGIIENQMYDPILKQEFEFTNPDSQTKAWYGQNNVTEPIWTTNQKAGDGRRSAAEWVGSQIKFADQDIINIPYNFTKPYKVLVDEFINLFTMDDPINFGALYFDEPDHTGHLYGPYSPQMNAKLEYLNEILGYLIQELKNHHLFEKLNLIITSDHGMDTISNNTVIFLDSYIDIDLIKAYGSRACYSIFVKNSSQIEYVYSKLKNIKNIDVYKKDEIPESLHYKNNVRVGDFLISTHVGYTLYINNQIINWTVNNGDHGYYNNISSMYPIFLAHGPAFKRNFTIKSFNNVDIYPLMCLILGIQPGVNNGSLEIVMDMIEDVMEQNFSYIFVLFSLIPITILVITTFFMCRNNNQNRHNTEYTRIANSAETAVFLTDENEDENNSRYNNQNE